MIYISIGSNVGNRRENLTRAVSALKDRIFDTLRCSIVIETECILLPDSPKDWDKPFLNMVVWGKSKLSPTELLIELKKIEQEIGRPKVYEKWAPRIIDLDILFFDDIALSTPTLTIPHQEIRNRPFLQHLLALIDPVKFQSSHPQPCFLRSFTLAQKLVGIINVTPDSFSDGGKYLKPEIAISKAFEMLDDGAEIIELGSQSTRPNAEIITPDQEYKRLEQVLEGLYFRSEKNFSVSIDSFFPEVIKKILKRYPISWINDVKGDLDDSALQQINKSNCGIILMHSLSVPPAKNIIIDPNIDPIETLLIWGGKSISKLISLGFSEEKIILDPGIGFGKSIYQNIQIIKGAQRLRDLGCKIMVGHSRKSLISAFSHANAPDRDLETIATSALLQDRVDYLRVHNVHDHMRFFVAQNCLNGGDYA